MKRPILMVGVVICLTGCVEQNMNDGLRQLKGQNISVAVAKLGYPDTQRTMLGDVIYVWTSSHDTTLFLPSTATTSGTVGNTPVYGTTTTTEAVPANFNCTIQMATDASGQIKSTQWSGNMGGCEPYANALKP